MSEKVLLIEDIASRIFYIRGHKVMLDSYLSSIYRVVTKVLNQAVKRNQKRFPDDFCFQLTQDEWNSLRSQFVTLEIIPDKHILMSGRGKYRKFLPYVFTEHGALMLASILNSEEAINASIFVVRAFIRPNQLQIHVFPFEGKRRSSPYNFHPRYLRQHIFDCFCYSIAEEFLLGITAPVHEG